MSSVLQIVRIARVGEVRHSHGHDIRVTHKELVWVAVIVMNWCVADVNCARNPVHRLMIEYELFCLTFFLDLESLSRLNAFVD